MVTHEELVARARGGDRAALEALMRDMKDLVYGLAARMLGNPSDADDATQEILIRLVTSLGSFRGDSAFRTWVYRVASNHLLTARGKRAKYAAETFDELATYLAEGVASAVPPSENALLIQEAKLACTSTMLHCLDRDHRLAYILGEVLDLASDEAAAILEISSDAYRKRLSRARTQMEEFLHATCGLVKLANACRCAKQGANAEAHGRVHVDRLTWVHRAKQRAPVEELAALERAVEAFRTELVAPEAVVEELRALIAGGELSLLS
jgi:RNA polymerase sigma factor (sigma-70 family)